MASRDVPGSEPPVDLVTTVHEWIWRHSSQPNGDPWDGDPEHLDLATKNLLEVLAPWLGALDPAPDSAPFTPR